MEEDPLADSGDGGSDSGRHTPKPSRKFYWPKMNDAGSPQMCGYVDKEEFGWGDSPEPLQIEMDLIIGPPKKKEVEESPVTRKRRSRQSKRKLISTADQDLATIKELTKNILGGHIPVCGPTISVGETKLTDAHVPLELGAVLTTITDIPAPSQPTLNPPSSEEKIGKSEPSTDSAIQSFFEDDDDLWLSQVDLGEPGRTPKRGKGGFVKSLSDNQLESPSRSNSLRRCSSFQPKGAPATTASRALGYGPDPHSITSGTDPQPLKKQKSFHVDRPPSQTTYTAEQIEQKRLQAIYRREFHQIERKKLEAQRRLQERQLRLARKTSQ